VSAYPLQLGKRAGAATLMCSRSVHYAFVAT